MERLLAALLIFALSLPVFWLGLVLMIQPFPYASAFFLAKSSDLAGTRMRTQEWSQDDTLPAQVDVLFLGSSTCMSGVDPNAMLAYGVNGFSFCSSGQRVGNSLHILHAALEESSPSVVVLDVFPLLWYGSANGIESSRDWARNGTQSNTHWTRAIFNNAIESGDAYNVMLTAAEWCFKYLGISPASLAKPRELQYQGRGYLTRGHSSLRDFPNCLSLQLGKASADEAWCERFEQLNTLCDEAGAQLIVLIPPELCPTAMVMPVCWAGIPVIRGQDWPGSQSHTFFKDNHHMVDAGAQSYSIWLAQTLNKTIQSHGFSP